MIQETARTGIVQKDKETVALIPEIKFGMMTPEDLEKIAAVSRKYEIPVLKITSAQRIALVGVKPENVEKVWEELGMEPGHGLGTGLNYIKACPGEAACRLGQRDSLGMAERIYDAVKPLGIESKIKFGVSGCPLACSEGIIRDVGIFGKRATGWTVQIGGNSGLNARLGEVLAKDLDDDQLIDVVVKLMTYYKENMKTKERMYRFVPRMGGIDAIKEALGLE
mgnify:FL=1